MLKVKLVSPEKLVAKGEFASILFPGLKGYLDVGSNHVALLTELGSGCITVRVEKEQQQRFFVSGGYAHIKENSVVVLGEVIEPSEKINLKRAKAAEKRATERLERTSDGSVQIGRALLAQERARERIKICEG